jgi:hypothetical protein
MGGYYKKTVIEEAVESHGGLTDGAALRFSIMWSGENKDDSDLDAWAKEPAGGKKIGYSTDYREDRGNSLRTPFSGQLDVDIIHPQQRKFKDIVENIAWNDLSKMKNGTYTFWIHNYTNRGFKYFEAEIKFGDEIYHYRYEGEFKHKAKIEIAKVKLKDGKFTIKHLLEPTA